LRFYLNILIEKNAALVGAKVSIFLLNNAQRKAEVVMPDVPDV